MARFEIDGRPAAAVLYALPEERRYFGDEYMALTVSPGSACGRDEAGPAQSGSARYPAFAVRIGIGYENAYRNTLRLLEGDWRPPALIIVGFAGGLDRTLQPGSVVVAERVLDTRSGCEHTPAGSLLAAASAADSVAPAPRGRLVTTDRVLCRALEKQALARTTAALAVDMESAGAAAAATEYGVPWLAVRVITDGVDDDLPFDFNAPEFKASADPFGGVNQGRIVLEALLHPWKVPALIRLGMRSSLAARNLATYLRPLLANLAEV